MGNIYAVCFYLDPNGPQSLAPDPVKHDYPEGAHFRLAAYQWFRYKGEGDPAKDPKERGWQNWEPIRDPVAPIGDPDRPFKEGADQMAFYLVSMADQPAPSDRDQKFSVYWTRQGKDDEGSPLQGARENHVLEPPDEGSDAYYPVVPPGMEGRGERSTWFYCYRVRDLKKRSQRGYTFRLFTSPPDESGGQHKTYFFVDPEMETRP